MSVYQLFPALAPDERHALRQDIEERGVLVPVELDENGNILDGHHRAEIAGELGIEYPTVERPGMSEAEKLEHVFAINIARRHLSGHDRTAVIALCRDRGMSLRAIGRVVGVSPQTVGRDLSVPNGTPEHLQPAQPLPATPTITEKARELTEEGRTLRAIAEELGVSHSTVHNALRKNVITPAEWPQTKRALDALADLSSNDARQVAATIPERRRRTVAKRLRQLGKYLTHIAYELEGDSK